MDRTKQIGPYGKQLTILTTKMIQSPLLSLSGRKKATKCLTEGTAVIYSSYGGIVDYAKLICENAPTVYYTLTVKNRRWKRRDNWIERNLLRRELFFRFLAKFPAGSVIELTATEINDSSLAVGLEIVLFPRTKRVLRNNDVE